MELELNVQVPGEEIKPNWKTLKSEDGIYLTIYTMTSVDEGANPGTCIKMEDGGCDLIPEQVSDVLKVESAKVEAEAYVYDVGSHYEEGGDMVEQKSFSENTGPIPDLETSKYISVNSNKAFMDEKLGVSSGLCHTFPLCSVFGPALGVTLKYMHPSLVHETLKILLQMQVIMKHSSQALCLS